MCSSLCLVWAEDVGGGCGVPHRNGGGEDSVHGSSVELGENVLGDVNVLEQSEEEHPLMSSTDHM